MTTTPDESLWNSRPIEDAQAAQIAALKTELADTLDKYRYWQKRANERGDENVTLWVRLAEYEGDEQPITAAERQQLTDDCAGTHAMTAGGKP